MTPPFDGPVILTYAEAFPPGPDPYPVPVHERQIRMCCSGCRVDAVITYTTYCTQEAYCPQTVRYCPLCGGGRDEINIEGEDF